MLGLLQVLLVRGEPRRALPDALPPELDEVRLGFGRIAVSETDAPSMLANLI